MALDRGKRIEQMMWKGAKQYKALYENSPLGMYRANPDGRLLMANPALVRMVGYGSFLDLASTPVEKGDYEPNYLDPGFRRLMTDGDRVRGLRECVEAARRLHDLRAGKRAGPRGVLTGPSSIVRAR